MSGDLWVFGYGSLMWHPGFPFAERRHARLTGYHRALCIYSMHYRGTPQAPGLVLGLDRGGACEGIAFRIPGDLAGQVLRYLRARELITGVYREALVPVELRDGSRATVEAVTFIAERAHPAFAGRLSLAVQARLVRTARGTTGCNLDYVLSTVCHLADLGIRERQLERLVALAARHVAHAPAGPSRSARTRALARHAAGPPLRIKAGRLRRGERIRFLYRQPRVR